MVSISYGCHKYVPIQDLTLLEASSNRANGASINIKFFNKHTPIIVGI